MRKILLFNIQLKMPINLICVSALLLITADTVADPLVPFTNSANSTPPTSVGQLQTAELEIVSNEKVMSLPTLSIPMQSAKLYSRITGFIKARFVDIGDKVKKNELLAIIDEPQIKAQQNKILADIDEAEAKLELAQLNDQRAERLVADNLISAAEQDRLRILRIQATARIASLQAQLTENLARQTFMEIRAPFDGVIIDRDLDVGDLVAANITQGTRSLFEIANTRKMRLNIHVPQNEIRYIATGDEVNATFTGYQNLRVKGRISRLSQAVNAQSGTMLVEAEFDNSVLDLPAGLRGIVQLNRASDPNKEQIFKAPLSALSYHKGHDAVVAVNNGEITFHQVDIVAKTQNNVLLTGKLAEIGKVVLNPNALLERGKRINFSKDNSKT